MLVARLGGELIGHLQLVAGDQPGEVELKNIDTGQASAFRRPAMPLPNTSWAKVRLSSSS